MFHKPKVIIAGWWGRGAHDLIMSCYMLVVCPYVLLLQVAECRSQQHYNWQVTYELTYHKHIALMYMYTGVDLDFTLKRQPFP